MRVISALQELSTAIFPVRTDGKSIGFVPTMGALHSGHLSLIKRSLDENDLTVVSIFVNPLQFDNQDDLKKYPRILNEDLEFLEGHEVDIVFTPLEVDFYRSKPLVSIDFGALVETLEGKYREGHFEGVGVVVSKLLHLVQPHRAYFGLKDLQQFLLIRQMCLDLSFQCEVIGVETVRESTGLALSSRNRRLSTEGKETATIIYQGLKQMEEGIFNKRSLSDLLQEIRGLYIQKKGFELEYLEAVNPLSLSAVEDYSGLDELAICVAGYVEGIRLIDNIYLRLK